MFGRFRMPKWPPHPLVTVLQGLRGDIGHILRHVHELKEQIMADFSGLQGDINELKQTVAETAARIERRLDEVLDDSVDQAATDNAAAEIREATAALKAIAPDPIDEDDQPAEPQQ